jgi:hypothetical protein
VCRMTHPTPPPKRVNNHLRLHIVSSRQQTKTAERRQIKRRGSNHHPPTTRSHHIDNQARITMLKARMAAKKKKTNSRRAPPPNLITEGEEEPYTEQKNTKARRGLCPSSWHVLKRRGLSSKGVQLKRGGVTKKTTMNANGGRRTSGGTSDDDTEIDTDSDCGITENGVFTRFFGGDEETDASLETASMLTSDPDDADGGGFWCSIHNMCGGCA